MALCHNKNRGIIKYGGEKKFVKEGQVGKREAWNWGFSFLGISPVIMDALKDQGIPLKTIYFGGAIVFGLGGMLLSTLTSSARERIGSINQVDNYLYIHSKGTFRYSIHLELRNLREKLRNLTRQIR